MTKVDIISGFLGAGKTTLIKKLLAEALSGEQVVLIENEFGEIGIDGGFLKEAGVEITEMNSGCICCTLVGDFGEALHKVVEQYHPARIIIEPSGVGKLSDVIAAVMNVQKDIDLELNNFVTVADATKCKMYMKNFGEFYNNQVESANTIILSRTQGMSEEKLTAAVALLQRVSRAPRIVQPALDVGAVRDDLLVMRVDVGVRHGRADEVDGAQVIPAEAFAPFGRDVAALDDEVLPVLHGRLHHLAHDGPEVVRELIVVFGREVGVAAPDEPHLQVVDGEVGVAVLLEHALRQEGLAGVRCAGYQDDHSLAPSSLFAFSRSLHVRIGMRALISSISLSHHLKARSRSTSSSSKRFLKTLAGLPTTMV